MGTLEATLESTVTTMARIERPLAELMCAWASTADQSWPGAPVALNPATVMNMPAKNTSNEYDTCSHRCQVTLIFQSLSLSTLLACLAAVSTVSTNDVGLMLEVGTNAC